jgi:DNA end-binding protein Ku
MTYLIMLTSIPCSEPSKFEDQYEDALKELLKKKQEGKPIERPERPKPTNVVNLMDALRQSVEASGASTGSKAKGSCASSARRTRKNGAAESEEDTPDGLTSCSKARLGSPAARVVILGRAAPFQWPG